MEYVQYCYDMLIILLHVFRWMNSYFQKGYKKKLTASDLYSEVDDNDKSSTVTEILSRYFFFILLS